MIKIRCKILETGDIKSVKVSPDDPVNILKEKLNIYDEIGKIIELKLNGDIFPLNSSKKFKEIGVERNDILLIDYRFVGGGAEDIVNKFNEYKEYKRKNKLKMKEWDIILLKHC